MTSAAGGAPRRGLARLRAEWLSPTAILHSDRPDPARVATSFAIACLAVLVLLTALSLLRHHTFHSSLYDVGIFHQMLWNTAHGRFFTSALKHGSYLGDHFSPSFGLLAPLEWLPRALDLLLLAQAAATVITAWNAFALARRHLDARAAWLIGMGTLLCPALYCPALADLHPEPFMAALLSLSLLDLDRGSTRRAALCMLLVLAGKEDAGLLLAPLGVILALHRPTRAFGVVLAVIALAWSALAVMVVMPSLRPAARAGAPWFYLGRLAHLGATPREILHTLLRHPLDTIVLSTTIRKLVTIAALLLPFALAPLRSLRLLAVLPFLAAHYLSARWTEFFFPFHYLVPAVPILAWAAIAGAPRTIARRPLLTAALCALCGALAIVWRCDPEPLTPRPNHAALRAALAVIPDGEPVCVENWFGAHLAAREAIDFCVLFEWEREQYHHYGWPEVSKARWQIFDLADAGGDHPGLAERLMALRTAGAEVMLERDRVVVLRVDEAVLARAAR
ncbi:MAG: DUF2079 domain-containing protein [Myxococcales bacterium]|nr:DUF2079 domain-containing protein [Myxococcales bacterium]